jgi:hypothetical protein
MQRFYTSLDLVGDPVLRAEADFFADYLATLARETYPTLADQLEGALHIRVDTREPAGGGPLVHSYSCGYYFIHAPSRAMCWLEEFSARDHDDLLGELAGVQEIWHLSQSAASRWGLSEWANSVLEDEFESGYWCTIHLW